VIAPDANVLLYALREDSARDHEYRAWLHAALNGTGRVALFEPILAAVMRIGTHPAIYRTPTPRPIIDTFIDRCLAAPAALALRADAGHWPLFRRLCRQADCLGNLVQNAYVAVMALEHDCTFVTTDRDFARFPRLRWRHPLEDAQAIENPAQPDPEQAADDSPV
jgi:hypothetical protein